VYPNEKSIFGPMALISLGLCMGSCGPMNQKPGDPATAPAANCLGSTGAVAEKDAMMMPSQENHFLFYAKPLQGSPHAGDNVYMIRLVHGNLEKSSQDAQILLTPRRQGSNPMPMPGHGPKVATAIRQEDGTFLATLNFRHAGDYDLKLEMTDGTVKDERWVSVHVSE
jgi:hypothetical protein